MERRPWPTAPTTTRPSPAKPAGHLARSRSRGAASTPTPPTVWTAGPTPIPLDATWPTALVARIVASFSKPGEQVVLLPWPTPHTHEQSTAVAVDKSSHHADGTEPDTELADALHTVEDLDRTGRVQRVPASPTTSGQAPRPFWADLVDGSGPTFAVDPTAATGAVESTASAAPTTASPAADLIITVLRANHSGDHTADLVALFAARLLRRGGVLAVLTHCDWDSGELTDPTGAVVAAGQNADLLYLQHIIACHAPVRDGRFAITDEHCGNDLDNAAGSRARHRAEVRGLPTPHRRIHSDVLVFTQPHDHRPPPSAATDRPPRGEDTGRPAHPTPQPPTPDHLARKARP